MPLCQLSPKTELYTVSFPGKQGSEKQRRMPHCARCKVQTSGRQKVEWTRVCGSAARWSRCPAVTLFFGESRSRTLKSRMQRRASARRGGGGMSRQPDTTHTQSRMAENVSLPLEASCFCLPVLPHKQGSFSRHRFYTSLPPACFQVWNVRAWRPEAAALVCCFSWLSLLRLFLGRCLENKYTFVARVE